MTVAQYVALLCDNPSPNNSSETPRLPSPHRALLGMVNHDQTCVSRSRTDYCLKIYNNL